MNRIGSQLESQQNKHYDYFTKYRKPKTLGQNTNYRGFIFFLIALTAIPLLFILNGVFDTIPNEITERAKAGITGGWNIVLTFQYEVKISRLISVLYGWSLILKLC